MQNVPFNLQLWDTQATAKATAKSEHERTNELATANQRLRFQVREREHAAEIVQRIIEELETRLTKRRAELVTANNALGAHAGGQENTGGAATAGTKDGKHWHPGRRISSRCQ